MSTKVDEVDDDRPSVGLRHYACCTYLDPHDLFRDKVFAERHWKRHRSWRRHFPEGLVCLQVLAWYWPPVLFVAIIGVLVGCYATWLQPLGAPNVTDTDLTTPFTLTGFALALLLVFRTNSSYDRWWEARKMWGQMLNITRNLVRQSEAWSSPEDAETRKAVVRWTIAMVCGMKAMLWRRRDLTRDLKDVLLPHELEWLHQKAHFPTAASQVLTAAVAKLHVPDFLRVTMDQEITNFHVNLAACERLFGQPIPIAYTRHTSRFLMMWAAFLPIALYNKFRWTTPVIAAAVAFLLFGVENIGVQIEQPFDPLPLDTFCKTVKKQLLVMPLCQQEARDLLAHQPKFIPPQTAAMGDEAQQQDTVINMGAANGH